jgi:hypothetical protein
MERFNNRYKRDMKTAVEWFQDQIIKIVNGTCELSEIQIFDKAKEMEKEQMEKVWVAGLYCETGDRQAFIDYYNENYKSE